MARYRIRSTPLSSRTEKTAQERLNPEQLAVVMHDEGPMLVLAGAGTGKTTTVTCRVARLIGSGVSPDEILLLTFTNKAARDMMQRAAAMIGEGIAGLWGGTFHHLCNMILRRHAGEIGFSESYTIMDRDDMKELMHDCISEAGITGAVPGPAVLVSICGLAKNAEAGIEETVEKRFSSASPNVEDIVRVVGLYEEKKRALNMMDFDDLLVYARMLLSENEAVARLYQQRFRYVLVDEYQDTNHIQATIVDILAALHRNLMVVGDDAQSIYSFRGANFENIIRFPDRYPDARTFRLTTNYRSTPEILDFANASISHNMRQFRKDLRSVRYNAGRPCCVALNDVYEQARFVVSRIVDLIADGGSLADMAVLYRSHYQSMELQMELQRQNIPFEVRSGLRFFEQAHVKDVLSYLRIVVNPYDELSWKRVLRLIPGIGNTTARKIFHAVTASADPLDEVFRIDRLVPRRAMDTFILFLNFIRSVREGENEGPAAAIEAVMANGYEHYLYNTYPNADTRVEDINQMALYAAGYAEMEDFISDLSMESPSAEQIPGASSGNEMLTLSTVHQAKGLEWKSVFVIGLNDGRFPSARAIREGDEEEERRLFYVAVTRAKEDLFLCYTLTGGSSGGSVFLRPSRFLTEIDENLYERLWIERNPW